MVGVDMNDPRLWAQCFKNYEQLRVMDNMSYSKKWAQGSRCYEKLRVVDDMNDLGPMSLGL